MAHQLSRQEISCRFLFFPPLQTAVKTVHKIQYGGIAQLVEQRSPKPRAESSILSAPANRKKVSASRGDLFGFTDYNAEGREKYKKVLDILGDK